MQISTIKRTWRFRHTSLSQFVTHPAVMRPSTGIKPGSVFPAAFRQGQVRQSSRQVSAAVQEIDDDHLLDVLNEHHEMLACPRNAMMQQTAETR